LVEKRFIRKSGIRDMAICGSSPMPDQQDFARLMERLGYTFRDPEILNEAFRHASYVNERAVPGLKDNERLEFLGDAVLDLAVSHILMELFQEAKEGELSKARASVVNEKELSHVARELGMGDYLLLGRGEEMGGGREKTSILADTLEAVIGAVYLDAGLDATKEVIRGLFHSLLSRLDSGAPMEDFKSMLQEYTQEVFKARPEYQPVRESGPSHDKVFRVAIFLHGRMLAEAEGKSKKDAEQKAAREAFHCLRDPGDV
jgi:ribonuclease III